MTTVHRTIERSIEDVFAVLADPWTYPDWLVGAKEMRSVDAGWPAPSSSFHHRVGLAGPLTIADSSTSLAISAPTMLELEVRARPAGRARVTFHLATLTSNKTEVAFSEEPLGLTRLLAPLAAVLSIPRNARSLKHLEQFLQG